VPDDEQGALAGGLGSIHSATEVVVPLVGGYLYSRLGAGVPYAVGVVFLLAAIAFIWPLLARARQASPSAAGDELT
jgi:hypothetical protein